REIAVVHRPRALDVWIREHVDRRRQQHVPVPEEPAPRGAILLALAVPENVVPGRALEPAQVRPREFVVRLAPHRDALLAALCVEPRPRHRRQERAVERVMLAEITEPVRLSALHRTTELAEPCRQV